MMMVKLATMVIMLMGMVHCYDEQHHGHYTNEFAVEIDAELHSVEEVARSHGMEVVHHMPSLGGIYLLTHSAVERRSKRGAEDLIDKLKEDARIKYVEQQKILKRVKRTIVHDKQWELPIRAYEDKSMYQRYQHADGEGMVAKDTIPRLSAKLKHLGFNDPFFPDQWYLINEGQTGGKRNYDINILPVWQRGITGKGVVVSILDDGVDHTHPDLTQNFDQRASANLNDRSDSTNDPMPDVRDSSNSHGTRCAGEVAAMANNSNCGVGVAYNARIGGVKMLDGMVTDALEGEALTYHNDYIDVYSASWGPSDDGMTMEGPGRYASKALREGVTQGRGGKGSIFVWATGNGGVVQDDCNCDGYVSSIETLSIGCISDHGLSTYFSEVCPSTMAVIFTGGDHTPPGEGMMATRPRVKVVTTDLKGECTLAFQGTSSAAPMAAGVFALVLEANPELTWRDVQHVVVHTARIPNDEEEGWTVNGAGFHVNHRFGFGAIDCATMVEAAQNWINVPAQRQCRVAADNPPASIPVAGTLNQTLKTDGCRADPASQVDHVEHVQVQVDIEHPKRGDLQIFLISPSGTRSEILSVRPLDDSANGIQFTLMTVHNWGEDPEGSWMLFVSDQAFGQRAGTTQGGRLISWSLTLWGFTGDHKLANTSPEPTSRKPERNAGSEAAHNPEKTEVDHIMASEEKMAQNVKIQDERENLLPSSGRRPFTKKEQEDLEDFLARVVDDPHLDLESKRIDRNYKHLRGRGYAREADKDGSLDLPARTLQKDSPRDRSLVPEPANEVQANYKDTQSREDRNKMKIKKTTEDLIEEIEKLLKEIDKKF